MFLSAVPLLAVILALGVSQAPPSEALRLPLDQYPPELRARVAAALRRTEQEPRDASAAGALGMLLHAHDQLEPAAVWYGRARGLAPGAFEWAYLEGVVQGRLGHNEAAAAAFADALETRPRYLPARLKRAEALLATGDLAASAALYGAILADEPRSPQARYGMGRVEAARGRTAAAAEHYLEATRLVEDFGAAQYALALAYRDLGREEEARSRLAIYQKHLLGAPPLEDPVLEEVLRLKEGAREHLAEGVRLGKVGDVLGSIREHERALADDPGLAQAHANLISLYGRQERWDQVEQHYRAAVALAPGLTDVHYDYGVALTRQGRARDAADVFRKALEINPYHARAHNNLGALLLEEGRFEEAAVELRAATANEPGFRLARFNLGRVLVAQGRLREAISELEKILTPEDEETPRYLYALGAACVRAGEREKGVARAQEARRKAEALGQAELVRSIDRDLRGLAAGPPP